MSFGPSTKPSAWFALLFFSGLIVALSLLVLRQSASAIWRDESQSPLMYGLGIVWGSGIVAGILTMVLFRGAYLDMLRSEPPIFLFYVAGAVWATGLGRLRWSLRRVLAARITAPLDPSESGLPEGINIRLRRKSLERWITWPTAGLALGLFLSSTNLVKTAAGQVAVATVAVSFVALAAGLLIKLFLRIRGFFQDPLPDKWPNINVRFRTAGNCMAEAVVTVCNGPDLREAMAQVVLLRRNPGDYDRETQKFGDTFSVSADVKREDAIRAAFRVPLVLPRIPASLEDRSNLEYGLRLTLSDGDSGFQNKDLTRLPFLPR